MVTAPGCQSTPFTLVALYRYACECTVERSGLVNIGALEERHVQRRIDSDQKQCHCNRKERGAKIQQRRDDPDPQEDVDAVRPGREDAPADGTLEPVSGHRKLDKWTIQIHFKSPEGKPICFAG